MQYLPVDPVLVQFNTGSTGPHFLTKDNCKTIATVITITKLIILYHEFRFSFQKIENRY